MLGLLILYFLAKPFYKLAERYDRSPIGYAVLAIFLYYVVIFGSSLIGGVVMELSSPGMVDTINESLLGLLFIPFGLVFLFFFYGYLEKRFRSGGRGGTPPEDLLDAQLIDQEV